MTQINNFDGGLSLRLDPSLIKLNEAQRLVNVDTNPAVLKSSKSFKETDVDVKKSFYFFQGEWLSFDEYKLFTEYENRLYFSGEKEKPQMIVDSVLYPMGIKNPESVPWFSAHSVEIRNQTTLQNTNFSSRWRTILGSLILSQGTEGKMSSGQKEYFFGLFSDNDVFIGFIVYNNNRITVSSKTNNISVSISFSNATYFKVRIFKLYLGKYKEIGLLPIGKQRTFVDVADRYASYYINTDISSFTKLVKGKGLGSNEGTYQYTETFYNDKTNTESKPSKYSNKYKFTEGYFAFLYRLSKNYDENVTHRRIYRIGGTLTNMYRVAEIPVQQEQYIDIKSDIEVLKDTKKLDLDTVPIKEVSFLTEANGTFFGLYKNEILFSKLDEPANWPPENSIKIRDVGTGLLSIPQGLLVFTSSSTYLLSGTDKENFSLLLISTSEGCINGKSCQVVKNLPLWISFNGICSLESGYVSVISKPLLGKKSFSVLQSLVYDEQYFILQEDRTIFVLDMRSGFRFYELDFGKEVDGFFVKESELYLSVKGKLCEAFKGEELKFKYKSPVFIENSHSELKMYNHIYIRAKGKFTVNMYIDDELVLTEEIEGNKTFDLTPPTVNQRGYNCSFEIEGKGTIYTINTQPLGIQNEN